MGKPTISRITGRMKKMKIASTIEPKFQRCRGGFQTRPYRSGGIRFSGDVALLRGIEATALGVEPRASQSRHQPRAEQRGGEAETDRHHRLRDDERDIRHL